MDKKKKKKLTLIRVVVIVFIIEQTCQLYKDVKEHSNKIITLDGDEARIQSAAASFKFFVSFWVRFHTRVYLRLGETPDVFAQKMAAASDHCIIRDPGSWVHFVLPYTIDKISATSFKLHPLEAQRTVITGATTCQTTSTAACVCSGRPFQDLDSEFGSIFLVPSGGTNQFTLTNFDGTSGKPEIRTLMSGLSTVNGDNILTHQVVAELMKGQSSNLFEVNYLSLDYNVIVPYLGRFTQEQAYWNIGYAGMSVWGGYYLDLGRHQKYAESTDSNKLIKNFCWNFFIRGTQDTQTVDRELIINLQLTTPDVTPPNYIVNEEITHHFYFYANQGVNPNKMESYITMTNGGTPVRFYEKTNLYSGDNKELDITSCYSKL